MPIKLEEDENGPIQEPHRFVMFLFEVQYFSVCCPSLVDFQSLK